MITQTAIKFEHVTKNFSRQTHKTFKEFLPALFLGEKTTNKFTALNDISFEIKKGECVGIIGPNGSGKSTILKLIAKVMSPTLGQVKVSGRVSPLIELGAGMHPELSGRENISLNGAILGISQDELKKNYDNIVEFSELKEYIDQPVKHYSSGMYMRLAFSIAIHVKPEILLVDEILAVGDENFQKKCFIKMSEFKKDQNVTVILVSHSLSQISQFCQRTLYLNHSHLISDSTTSASIKKYQEDISK